jgi:hypothetical protein
MEALSEDFVKMFEEARARNRFDPHSYTSPLMQRAIRRGTQRSRNYGSRVRALI